MSYRADLGGISAPANFEDSEEVSDMTPLDAIFDIGGYGSRTPYSSCVDAVLHKHKDELVTKALTALELNTNWKNRLKEFMNMKNNDLLKFLNIKVESHPHIGAAEVILRRFGNPQIYPNHPSVRDFVLDNSGVQVIIEEVSQALEAKREGAEGGIKGYVAQTTHLYEMYQKAGEEVLKIEGQLKRKLQKLDRIQGKLSPLFEIDKNEKFQPLMEATEVYLAKIFNDSQIKDDYEKVIEAYRRFAVLRDIVSMSRAIQIHESHPLCSICLHEQVTYALAPCGHTFCTGCMRQQNSACYMCRGAIKDRVKLYFG
jgi:hypothetical protein